VRTNPALFELGDLRARHLHELVTVEGVAASVGPVGATAAVALFECHACGAEVEQRPAGVRLSPPGRCVERDGVDTLAFRPDRSTFVDLRRVELAPPHDERADGADPRTVGLFLADDPADAVAPGDGFLATGVVRPVAAGPSNRFDLCIEGVGVTDERRPVPDRSLAEVIQSRWESMGGE
jgi:DNA replicative helicase MCM subunit Mcm2 (Cdc46/Mcm family)